MDVLFEVELRFSSLTSSHTASEQPKKEAEDAHVEAVKLAEKYDEYESELMALDDAAAKWAIYEPYLKV